jgi:hypothetical protein
VFKFRETCLQGFENLAGPQTELKISIMTIELRFMAKIQIAFYYPLEN